MRSSLSQEFFKFRRLRLPLLGLIFVILAMVYTASTQPSITSSIEQQFGGSQWIIIAMIMITAQIFGIEFKNGTLPTVVFKNVRNKNVLISKVFISILYLFSATLLMSLTFLGILVFHQRLDLMNVQLIVNNIASTIIYGLFIISLISLLTILFRSTAIADLIGMAIVFLGAPINDMLFQSFPNLQVFLKWNPLNMIYISSQLPNDQIMEFSHLTNVEMIIANLVYIFIFFLIDYLLVRKNYWLIKE